ncbi:MAG TPA: hypothetical protein VFT99_21085, partial [Roseiflexaceae bacterium]|nr:hypothetical protein [Roseiflexaceae bacterium]
DRDLTDADHLYFNTVAITGTHSDSAVRIVQDAWKGGPQKFGELDAQWERNVRNQANGDDAAWTTMTLEQALKDEMDMEGEAWGFVKAVLDGYHAFKAGNFAPGADGAMTDEQLEALETIQLNTAWATLDAAASGAGTNEAQMQNAAADIRRIWNRRIEWATRQNRQDKLAEYRQNWEHEQQQLRARIDDEMDADGDENLRARLLMQGDLTIADEVYLAKQAVDYDQVRALVTRAWGAGKLGELQQKSREERTDAGGVVVRPRFDTTLLVPVTSGTDWSRVYELVRDGATDAARGAARLKLELDQGNDESDLKRAYDFVTAAQDPTLRTGVVTTYVQANLADTPGETAVKKFLNAISTRYKQSYSCYQFMDLLDPAATPQQMLERAEGRKKASNSGVMNAVLNYYVAQYDTVTGEDSQQVVDESIERLRFIVQHSGARQDELAAMMAMTGETTPEGLAKREYGDFVKRLEELRALKRAVADAIAQVVELAVDALITVLTGGAGAAMLVASLGAAIAGMVARELMLGQDYDLLSKE